MTKIFIAAFFLIMSSCSSTSPRSTTAGTQAPTDKDWTFESYPHWSDEFNYNGKPDSSKWGYDLGGDGWGNNELQHYTNDKKNAKVENGQLHISAIKEKTGERAYSSARLISKNKGDFLYGRIEVRAKLPAGRGTWPAIWMLPTDWEYGGWPESGEIDIMEHVGYDPNNVLSSIHTKAYNHGIGTQKSGGKNIPTSMTGFHDYRLDWTPYAIRCYFDNELVFTFINQGKTFAEWPFDKRFHLLLNLAVGGNWGGAKGVDETIFPATMVVDHVRVYKMIEK